MIYSNIEYTNALTKYKTGLARIMHVGLTWLFDRLLDQQLVEVENSAAYNSVTLSKLAGKLLARLMEKESHES